MTRTGYDDSALKKLQAELDAAKVRLLTSV